MENIGFRNSILKNLEFKKHDNPKINVKDSKESLEMIRSAFAGKRSASFDMLALNAAAVIYIGGKSKI